MISLDKTYLGTVEDIDDPLKIGRCKVRVGFLFGDIPVDDIPWAYPAYALTFGGNGQCGSISVPKIGAIVKVKFDNGNAYTPIYESMQELSDEVKSFLSSNYEGTHILLYDSDSGIKIYYILGFGFKILLSDSEISIDNGGVVSLKYADQSYIELNEGTITQSANDKIEFAAINQIKGSAKIVELGGTSITKIGRGNPNSPAVLGDRLFELLKALASILDDKNPKSTGAAAQLVESFKSLTLSKNVKLSD